MEQMIAGRGLQDRFMVDSAGLYGGHSGSLPVTGDEFRPVGAIPLTGLLEYMDSGVALLEIGEQLRLLYVSPSFCRIIGAEKMLNAQGQAGGIIHIGHFTNWEAFGLAGAVYGVDKAVLAQRVDNPYVDEETNRLRNIFSGRTFYSNYEDKPFFACMRWLKKKKMLGILIDQNAGSSEVWIPFMGRIAAFSPITALLSIKMQVPVFPVRADRKRFLQSRPVLRVLTFARVRRLLLSP